LGSSSRGVPPIGDVMFTVASIFVFASFFALAFTRRHHD
jgi:hypothetical protein